MQYPGARGRHNPSVLKTPQCTFDKDTGFNTTSVIHAIQQFIFI